MDINITAVAVLLAFYLFLLVRPQTVKRPRMYWLGVWTLVAAFASGYILLSKDSDAIRVVMFFKTTATIIALLAGVMACYPGALPFPVPFLDQERTLPESGKAPPPPAE